MSARAAPVGQPPGSAESEQGLKVSARESLARKGVWSLCALLAYLAVATLVIALERHSMIRAVEDLERLHFQEEQQATLNMTVAHAVREVNEHYFAEDVERSFGELGIDVEAILSRLHKISAANPEFDEPIQALEGMRQRLANEPTRATVADLRSVYHELVIALDAATVRVRERKQQVLAGYGDAAQRALVEWLVLVVLGIGVFAGAGSLFVAGLSRDLISAKTRAVEIVRGYRGAPLAVERRDELGALIDAINRMQNELDEREVALELSRHQHFHTEKMAAVGSLAAAVAHEINNPLAAIVGVAETIAEEAQSHGCHGRGAPCQPQLILEQARRVMQITRQISEFSVPRPLEPELADVNALVRSTSSFVGFDKRFRGIAMEQVLDPALPAVVIVSDHVVQILMNLLINAADALAEQRPAKPRIVVSTRSAGEQVEIAVSDNGPGIAPDHLAQVFDEHFTTKQPGRGSGLGLSVCRRLARDDGGEVCLESSPGNGATARILLPLAGRQNT